MTSYLWTGTGQPPPAYTAMIMCRDTYHCPPSQYRRRRLLSLPDVYVRAACELWHCTPEDLRGERLVDVLQHLQCANTEAEVKEARARSKPYGSSGQPRPQ